MILHTLLSLCQYILTPLASVALGLGMVLRRAKDEDCWPT